MAVTFDHSGIICRLDANATVTFELVAERVPGDIRVVSRIEGTAGVARLDRIVECEVTLVPCTDDDFRMLPSLPPSVRRRPQLCERVREEIVAIGGAPTSIAQGSRIKVFVDVTAPNSPGQIHAAALVLEGQTWGRVEVPIVVLTGTTAYDVEVLPKEVFASVRPGTVKRFTILVPYAPASAMVVPVLNPPNPALRIAEVISFKHERREYTEEQLDAEPDEATRQKMREEGYMAQVEQARAPAGTPIRVDTPGGLRVEVDVTAPATNFPDWSGSWLEIVSTAWRKVSVPFSIFFAHLEVGWTVNALQARQGATSEEFVATLTAQGGTATDVKFEIGADWQPWHIVPSSVHVGRGARVEARLRIAVDETAPVGVHGTSIWATWYDGREKKSSPLTLTVRPGALVVNALQRSVIARQGERVTLPVQVKSQGGHKRIVFSPTLLPAGVRMDQVVWERDGAAFEQVNLTLVVDPLARPRDRARVVVNWSAGDTEHAGSLEFDLTVQLQPEHRVFAQPVVTPDGSTLGGRVELELHNNGHGRFRGRMFTSGALSYHFRVRAVLRSPDGSRSLVVQKTGAVKGSLDPSGSSRFEWDDPLERDRVRDDWAHWRNAALVISKSYELTGPIGAVMDGFLDVMEFVASSALLNPVIPGAPALAGLVLVGSELNSLTGLRVVGPGGLVGLATAGAATVLVGPGVIIPVFVGGILATAATVRFKPLDATERGIASAVFGDTLPFDRIVKTNLTGVGGRAFVVPNVDQQILVNLGDNFHDVSRPTTQYPQPNQLFIHELTHAWQIAHGGRPSEFVWSGVMDQLAGDEAYFYGPPGPSWSSFTNEAQASVVDEWFTGTDFRAVVKMPGRLRQSSNDPYFPYIENHIRLGQA